MATHITPGKDLVQLVEYALDKNMTVVIFLGFSLLITATENWFRILLNERRHAFYFAVQRIFFFSYFRHIADKRADFFDKFEFKSAGNSKQNIFSHFFLSPDVKFKSKRGNLKLSLY